MTEELRCRDQDRIIQECCTLLGCDRASLFIVDQKTGDLLLQLGKDLDSTIRVPKGSGVAGYVATTGESTNIVDAYEDPRFSKDADAKTGYKTSTILCVPVRDSDGKTMYVRQASPHLRRPCSRV